MGVTLTFLATGATASPPGPWLAPHKIRVGLTGSVLRVVWLLMLGLIRPRSLFRDRRAGLQPPRTSRSFTLSRFGWTPWIGPVPESALTRAVSGAGLAAGVPRLGASSPGLAVPLLLPALLWRRVNVRRLHRYSQTVERKAAFWSP